MILLSILCVDCLLREIEGCLDSFANKLSHFKDIVARRFSVSTFVYSRCLLGCVFFSVLVFMYVEVHVHNIIHYVYVHYTRLLCQYLSWSANYVLDVNYRAVRHLVIGT